MSRAAARDLLAGHLDADRLPLHCHSILRELGLAVRAHQVALVLQSIDPDAPSYRLCLRVFDPSRVRLRLEPCQGPRIVPALDVIGWAEQAGVGPESCSHLRALLYQVEDFSLIVDANRQPGDDPFGAADIIVLQGIAPGLALAIKAMMNCAPSSLATDIFRRLPFGVALLDADRRVLFQNTAMLDILKRRDGLHADEGRLHIRPIVAQRALIHAMRPLLSGDASRSGLMVWPRDKNRLAYLATAERFHAGFFMVGKGEPTVRLTVVDPDYSDDNAIAHVAAHFGLTPSEIDIVQAMVLGLDVAECAARLKLAVNTVRWHQKRIFAKTGTSGRSALILLFVRGSQLQGA